MRALVKEEESKRELQAVQDDLKRAEVTSISDKAYLHSNVGIRR